jgi:aminoglycoside 3-N-acetyltransferase
MRIFTGSFTEQRPMTFIPFYDRWGQGKEQRRRGKTLMWSRSELERDFRALGVIEGDVVMLHASVRSVGEVAGGPDQIHLALRDALGASGTLMMYVGCPSYYDDVGRGLLTAEQEREVVAKHPTFDPLTTRSARSHGILVEFFRTFPGTLVNNHVARFAGAGAHASDLLAEHPWNFPYGVGSPLDRFRMLGGKILLLGSDHDEVTFLHHVEHVVEFAGKKISRYKVPYEMGGRTVWREVDEVNTAGDGAHANWPERFFAQIVDGYLESTGNHGCRVGNAAAFVIPAQGLYDFACPIMQATAAGI